MDQSLFIARLRDRIETIDDVLALFLSGSFGKSEADAYSDVDLLVLTAPEHQAAVAQAMTALIGAIEPVVFVGERRQGALLVNLITENWLRCDLVIAPPDVLNLSAKDLVRPLFDPDERYAALPDERSRTASDGAAVERLVREFLRVLGLLVVIDGRGEYVTGAAGAALLRGLLAELMVAPIAPVYRGGALHLSRLLGPGDRQILGGLRLPGNDRQSVIESHYAIARAFLPLARKQMAEFDIAWPQAFETATRRSLERHFGAAPDL